MLNRSRSLPPSTLPARAARSGLPPLSSARPPALFTAGAVNRWAAATLLRQTAASAVALYALPGGAAGGGGARVEPLLRSGRAAPLPPPCTWLACYCGERDVVAR